MLFALSVISIYRYLHIVQIAAAPPKATCTWVLDSRIGCVYVHTTWARGTWYMISKWPGLSRPADSRSSVNPHEAAINTGAQSRANHHVDSAMQFGAWLTRSTAFGNLLDLILACSKRVMQFSVSNWYELIDVNLSIITSLPCLQRNV